MNREDITKAAQETAHKTAQLPAEMLAMTLTETHRVVEALPTEQVKKSVKKAEDYWHTLGPGLTTGASDDDPSGIATYSQAGAKYGFNLLWMAAFTLPMMAAVQEMCARIGMVTGRGLAGNIRLHFSRRLLYVSTMLLFAANAFNIGADLGAMAKGVQLIFPNWNFSLLVIGFALFSLALQILTPYEKYARYMKWLALVLLTYVASAILARLDWGEVVKKAFVPHFIGGKDQLLLICAILGTTISPYLFFWQTSQEVEEEITKGKTSIASRRGTTKEEVKNMRIDVWSGMLLSNIVMFFIIAACGALLFTNGITEINSAAQAAEALRPFAGDATYFLFAVGIVGTGLLAIPVLAGSSSYALAESFKWKEGLTKKFKQAHAFYGVIIVSMFIGLSLNFVGLDPIDALIYAGVANGIVAPVILLPIVLMSSNKKIMGEWVNRKYLTFFGWIIVAVMSLTGVATLISLVL